MWIIIGLILNLEFEIDKFHLTVKFLTIDLFFDHTESLGESEKEMIIDHEADFFDTTNNFQANASDNDLDKRLSENDFDDDSFYLNKESSVEKTSESYCFLGKDLKDSEETNSQQYLHIEEEENDKYQSDDGNDDLDVAELENNELLNVPINRVSVELEVENDDAGSDRIDTLDTDYDNDLTHSTTDYGQYEPHTIDHALDPEFDNF